MNFVIVQGAQEIKGVNAGPWTSSEFCTGPRGPGVNFILAHVLTVPEVPVPALTNAETRGANVTLAHGVMD